MSVLILEVKGLVGEEGRSQERGEHLESYEILVCLGKAQVFMEEFKASARLLFKNVMLHF